MVVRQAELKRTNVKSTSEQSKATNLKEKPRKATITICKGKIRDVEDKIQKNGEHHISMPSSAYLDRFSLVL